VKLIKVDAFDAEAAQRRLALFPDGFRLQHSLRLLRPVMLVPDQAALRKNKGPLRLRQGMNNPPYDFLRMTEAVHCGRINPIDSKVDSMSDCLF